MVLNIRKNIKCFPVLMIYAEIYNSLFWRNVETTDLPTKMWNFWNNCAHIHLMSLCLGWTLLAPSSYCGGMSILRISCWCFLLIVYCSSSVITIIDVIATICFLYLLRYLVNVFWGRMLLMRCKNFHQYTCVQLLK